MLTKEDNKFADMAADPIRRRTAIAGLSKRLTMMFWCSMLMAVLALLECWNGKATDAILGAAVFFSICFKVESDLRLLMVTERLETDKDEKNPA